MEIYTIEVEFKVIVSPLLKHIRHEALSFTSKAVNVHKENRQTERAERGKNSSNSNSNPSMKGNRFPVS